MLDWFRKKNPFKECWVWEEELLVELSAVLHLK